MYRVHPLPESMTDYIFDFGSLSADTERMYIRKMLSLALVQVGVEGGDRERVGVQCNHSMEVCPSKLGARVGGRAGAAQ